MAETDLYPPIKRFLEAQGYVVKAEVRSCDVVAVRGEEAPVIVELKTAINLQLYYQAIDRLGMTDTVYVAVPRPKRGVPSDAIKLCKRIGIGLIIVTAAGSVEVLADPSPYAPRKDKKRLGKLLGEFHKRNGDYNLGGSVGKKLMTAYRQDAIKCAEHLAAFGAASPKEIKNTTGVDRAATILRDNVYGWFDRVERGVYTLSPSAAANWQ